MTKHGPSAESSLLDIFETLRSSLLHHHHTLFFSLADHTALTLRFETSQHLDLVLVSTAHTKMGKKRKNVPSLQDLLDRPICYYCERDFEDMSYLVDHMKAKHYKCGRCSRRLTTAGGLGVHMKQVHKEELTKIDNAMKEREKPDVEIFGMEGFPPKLLESIKTRITNEFFKDEQRQRQETGNPPRGTQPVASNPQKQESIEEMKARLAERKAQRAAEKAAAANGSGSGNNTPPVNNDAAVSDSINLHSTSSLTFVNSQATMQDSSAHGYPKVRLHLHSNHVSLTFLTFSPALSPSTRLATRVLRSAALTTTSRRCAVMM